MTLPLLSRHRVHFSASVRVGGHCDFFDKQNRMKVMLWKDQVWFLTGLEVSLFCLLEAGCHVNVQLLETTILWEGQEHGEVQEKKLPFPSPLLPLPLAKERDRINEPRSIDIEVLDMWERIHHFGSGSTSPSCLCRCQKWITQPFTDCLNPSQIPKPLVISRIKWWL